MFSDWSSSQMPVTSLLHVTTVREAPAVEEDDEDVEVDVVGLSEPSSPVATPTVAPTTGLDSNVVEQIQNNSAFKTFLAANVPTVENNANSLNTLQMIRANQESPFFDDWLLKKNRPKAFLDGFFMTYDKLSSCRQKRFWRCEYTNSCKARLHTDLASEKIVTFIGKHNHRAPTNDEIRLYGIDPDKFERSRVYVIEACPDPVQRRKIRKADRRALLRRAKNKQLQGQSASQAATPVVSAETELCDQGTPLAPLPSVATTSAFSADAAASISSLLFGHQSFATQDGLLLSQVSPSLPCSSSSSDAVPSPSIKVVRVDELPSVAGPQETLRRPISEHLKNCDGDEFKSHPLFLPTFKIAQQLRLLNPERPSGYPRTNPNSPAHFDFYLAKEEGTGEYLFVPIHIEQRNEEHLKEALEIFAKQSCNGMLVFGMTPTMSVVFSQPMLSEWENNQYFVLDVSNPSRWRLKYVNN